MSEINLTDESAGGVGSNDDPIDLRAGKPGALSATPVDQYSEQWANVVRPLTRAIFTILAAILFIPFVIIAFGADAVVVEAAVDWAQTILAPVVGFASAAVGYYYGTRQVGIGSEEHSSASTD